MGSRLLRCARSSHASSSGIPSTKSWLRPATACPRRKDHSMTGQSILAVDVGGSHVKLLVSSDGAESRRFASGPDLAPQIMIDGIAALTGDWSYECRLGGRSRSGARRSGRLRAGQPRARLGRVRFRGGVRQADEGRQRRGDAGARAATRAAGCCSSGSGPGLGTTLVVDGIVEPMELGHLPFRKATFEDYVGERGRKRLGKKKWHEGGRRGDRAADGRARAGLRRARWRKREEGRRPAANVRLGGNDNAFVGGFRLWDPTMPSLKHD